MSKAIMSGANFKTKQSGAIDISKIISDTRTYNFTDDDEINLLALWGEVEEYQEEYKETKNAELNIENPTSNLTKSQKRKLKKKSKSKKLSVFQENENLTPLGSIMKEVTANLGVENPLDNLVKNIENNKSNKINKNDRSNNNNNDDANNNSSVQSNSKKKSSDVDVIPHLETSHSNDNVSISSDTCGNKSAVQEISDENRSKSADFNSVNDSSSNNDSSNNINDNSHSNIDITPNAANDTTSLNVNVHDVVIEDDDDEDDDDSVPDLLQKNAPVSSPNGFDYPLKVESGGLLWTYSMKLPPILEILFKVLRGIFPNIKNSDFSGKNITIFPPPKEKSNAISVVSRATHGCSRIIACLGTCEQLTFEVNQGRTNIGTEYFLAKNKAIFMGFGICSSVGISFSDTSGFMYKSKPTDRGRSMSKDPTKRWVVIIDFISDTNALSRKFNEVTNSATKGDIKLKESIESRLGNMISDKDLVAQSAAAKAAARAAARESVKIKTPVSVDEHSSNIYQNNNNNQSSNIVQNIAQSPNIVQNSDQNSDQPPNIVQNVQNIQNIDQPSNNNNNDQPSNNNNDDQPNEDRKMSRQERRAKEAALAKAGKKKNKITSSINVPQLTTSVNDKLREKNLESAQKKKNEKEKKKNEEEKEGEIIKIIKKQAGEDKEDWSIDDTNQ